MIKAIIFDFFDVFRTDAYKSWLAANGHTHEGEWFRASRQQDLGEITNEEFYVRLAHLSGHKVTHGELNANARVDSAVVQLAEKLHQRYRTALLSNAPSNRLRELLAEHDLERLFDHVIVSSEVGLAKPDPAIFHLALDRLGVAAPEAVFIDDNASHTTAASRLGIRSIQFLSAEQLAADLLAGGVELS